MTEPVRFYWRGQDASIPPGAIPEQDRRPLRLSRSSVQSCAPDVIKQLEEGRFVAAVWETDGQIYVILCHPYLAKGPADFSLVNTAILPQLMLKLSGWDQAPELTRLLLRAFGSEAANADECAAARRELGSWLTANGQPEDGQTRPALFRVSVRRKIGHPRRHQRLAESLDQRPERTTGSALERGGATVFGFELVARRRVLRLR